jgi:signal transduction histidine kinase
MISKTLSSQRQMIEKTIKDKPRLQAVDRTGLLDTPEEVGFDRLTKLASMLLKTPISFVTLLVEDRDFIKSQHGLPELIANDRNIRDHPSFCQHIISHRKPLVLTDARLDPLFADLPSVKNMGVVAYAGIPLIDDDGFALGTCCVLDFTPRVWLDEEITILTELAASVMTEINLRKATLKLIDESAAKDIFIQAASHELRTPITSLKALAQFNTKRYEKLGQEAVANSFDSMHHQVARLDRLITKMLDVSRLQEGGLPLTLETCSLSEIVSEMVNEIRLITPRTVTLTTSATNDRVSVDRDKIGQVITNLVMNALHYSPEESPIDINISSTDLLCRVEVKDYGIGIPPDAQGRIFERFYRVPHSEGNQHPGLGLGLHLSYHIILEHRGELTVLSQLGQGSIFIMALPIINRE